MHYRPVKNVVMSFDIRHNRALLLGLAVVVVIVVAAIWYVGNYQPAGPGLG